MHERDCSCASILRYLSAASDGATVVRQVQKRFFRPFCRRLRRDSVSIYESNWTKFSSSVRELGGLYNALKLS